MADDEKTQVPTDSRQPGFNPEVEESHKAAAAAAAAQQQAAETASAPSAAPPPPRSRCAACGAFFEELIETCLHCGSSSAIEKIDAPKDK